jgi:hypothetical protein
MSVLGHRYDAAPTECVIGTYSHVRATTGHSGVGDLGSGVRAGAAWFPDDLTMPLRSPRQRVVTSNSVKIWHRRASSATSALTSISRGMGCRTVAAAAGGRGDSRAGPALGMRR